jgi:hypothetical protein
MWIVLLTLIVVAAAFIWLRIIKRSNEPEKDLPTYVCPECGDKHCNCYLEEELK